MRIGRECLLLVDGVANGGLGLEHLLDCMVLALLGNILGRDGGGRHETARIIFAVNVIHSLLFHVPVHFDAIARLRNIVCFYTLVWRDANDSTTGRQSVLWSIFIPSVHSDVR